MFWHHGMHLNLGTSLVSVIFECQAIAQGYALLFQMSCMQSVYIHRSFWPFTSYLKICCHKHALVELQKESDIHKINTCRMHRYQTIITSCDCFLFRGHLVL